LAILNFKKGGLRWLEFICGGNDLSPLLFYHQNQSQYII